jgi:hypothetical protein
MESRWKEREGACGQVQEMSRCQNGEAHPDPRAAFSLCIGFGKLPPVTDPSKASSFSQFSHSYLKKVKMNTENITRYCREERGFVDLILKKLGCKS